MQVFFGKSDYSGEPFVLPAGLALTVGPYSHAAVGGPLRASIDVRGDELALQELYGLLGCPVRLDNDLGEAVWWGLVVTVDAPLDGILTRYSLLEVFNRVRVDYVVETGHDNGQATTTGWSSDSASVSRFKTRELIVQKGNMSDVGALQLRATELERRAWPRGQETGEASEDKAGLWEGHIECRGFWSQMGRIHLERADLAAAANTVIAGSAFDAWPNNSFEWHQSFTVAAATTARLIEIYGGRRPGLPFDPGNNPPQHTASIRSGIARPTTTLQASASVFFNDVPDEKDWIPFLLTADAALLPGITYWVSLGHTYGTGGIPLELHMDEALSFTGGVFRRAQGGGFAARVPDADMVFGVYSQEDSMQVLADLCTVVGVDYITGADVSGTSGVEMLELLEDDQNLLDKCETIIDQGTTSSRRVLPRVDVERRVQIAAEPAPDADDWLRETYRVVRDPQGQVADLSRCPAGMWLKRSSPMAQALEDGGAMHEFVEESEYDPRSGRWRPRFAGQPDPYNFTVLQTMGLPS